MSDLRDYPGSDSQYSMDSNAFHRACYILDEQVSIEEIRQRFEALLAKSQGTRFEVWTREKMAGELLGRKLYAEARAMADAAVELRTDGYDSVVARQVLAVLDEAGL